MADLYLKILVIGDSYVGKTSLLLKYTDGYFSEAHIATIGVEFKQKIINLNDRKIGLQIWDTSGQERFRSITQSFYRGADGVLFVFDVTNKDSFDNMKMWLNEVNDLDAKKILVGNKIDLVDQRVITKEKMEELAAKNKLVSFETSAKTGVNVENIYTKITELILANKSEEEITKLYSNHKQNINISSEDTKKNKKKKCIIY